VLSNFGDRWHNFKSIPPKKRLHRFGHSSSFSTTPFLHCSLSSCLTMNLSAGLVVISTFPFLLMCIASSIVVVIVHPIVLHFACLCFLSWAWWLASIGNQHLIAQVLRQRFLQISIQSFITVILIFNNTFNSFCLNRIFLFTKASLFVSHLP
jgi:hypothetical protein